MNRAVRLGNHPHPIGEKVKDRVPEHGLPPIIAPIPQQ